MTSAKSSKVSPALAALVNTIKQLQQQEQIGGLIAPLVSFAQETLGMSFVWLALYNETSKQLIGQGGTTPVGDHLLLKQKLTLAAGSLLDQVLMNRKPISLPSLKEEPRLAELREAATRLGLQGTAIYPIIRQRQALGILMVGSTAWGDTLRGDDLAHMSLLVSALGAELERLTATQATKAAPAAKQAAAPTIGSEDPIRHLLQEASRASSLGQRIEALLRAVHQFCQPQRTSLFWRDLEQPLYRRRSYTVGKPQSRESQRQPLAITQQELAGCYTALASGQTVSVSDSQSVVSATAPLRLMQMLNCRALVATPILVGTDVIGFLTLEHNEPYPWNDNERKLLQVAAELLALAAPTERLEHLLAQTQHTQSLVSELAQAICDEQDWKQVLHHAGEKLAADLGAQWVFLLTYNPLTQAFDVLLQYPAPRGRDRHPPFPPLQKMDWQLLETATTAVALEDYRHELRLHSWKEVLGKLNIQSLLVATTTPGHSLEALLLVGRNEPTTWGKSQQTLVQEVARTLGLISHQWQLQNTNTQQEQVRSAMLAGLTALQRTQNLERIELTGLQQLMNLMQVPLVALVTWRPGQTIGSIVAPPPGHPKFAIRHEAEVAIYEDPLIHSALMASQADNYGNPYAWLIQTTAAELDSRTREWLSGPDIGQILAIALRTDPEYEPSGVLIVADRRDRHWSTLHLEAFITLVNHLAWAHRSTSLIQMLTQGWQTLETLNWYKHRRLEQVYGQLAGFCNQLTQWLQQHPEVDPLLRRLGTLLQTQLESLHPLLSHEVWQLDKASDTAGLAVLLKRVMDRIENWKQRKQLWIQVHNQPVLTLSGDINKLELILYELLLFACQRSPSQGRIDIWCQQIESLGQGGKIQSWLELSITDNGEVEPQLLIKLHQLEHLDWLAPSSLDQPPGRHLKVCFNLCQRLGYNLDMYKLEDGRFLSRLLIPLNNGDTGTFELQSSQPRQ
ncbi:MAG: GAF domain-containing protein [Thermosynechococcus sp. Uc]|uniref:GAF domain-containing protein n=1 Tax=Thermosynechococcus sp. Uc TaxID=3034853 RepID=UPI00259E31B5|nr:GAF domain-containing protein [Thermosynechococcus sp. Uc]MDM7325577.1 GAF domain-containing protein [Thermosynechococcus sp. Uc]